MEQLGSNEIWSPHMETNPRLRILDKVQVDANIYVRELQDLNKYLISNGDSKKLWKCLKSLTKPGDVVELLVVIWEN